MKSKINSLPESVYTSLANFQASPTIGLNSVLQNLNNSLKKPIAMFTAGYPGFLPPECVIEKVNKAQYDIKWQKYHKTQGNLELRKLLAKQNKISPENVAINGGGAKFTLVAVMSMMLSPCENKFVLFDCRNGAAWKTHRDVINRLGSQTIDLTDVSMAPDFIAEKSAMREIAFGLTSRGNPHPYTRKKEGAQALIKFLYEQKCKLIVDDAYEDFFKNEPEYVNWLSLEKEINCPGTVIKVISMSKAWSAPGWRMGALMCRDTDFINRFTNLLESFSSMAPVHYQIGWQEALSNPKVKAWQDKIIITMKKRQKHYAKKFKGLGFKAIEGPGIYLWLNTEHLAGKKYRGPIEVPTQKDLLPIKPNKNFEIRSSKSLNLLAIQAARFAGISGFGTSWGWRITLNQPREEFDIAFGRLEKMIKRLAD